MAFEFVPAGPQHRSAILDLFRAAFLSEPNPAEWVWKYDTNPHESISVLALLEGNAVGFFGGVGTVYRGEAGTLPGSMSVDVMTHPSARSLGRQGLFKELGEVYGRLNGARGVPFDFGFPHERARKIEERLLGYLTIERAGQFSHPTPLARAGRMSHLLTRKVWDEAFGFRHESLAEDIHSRPGWRTDRSAAVLNWRFRNRPGVSYHTLQLFGLTGRSRGYAVYRMSNDRALIVDIQTGRSANDLPDLLAELGAGLPEGARSVVVRLPVSSTMARQLVEEFGFLPEESDTHLLARPLIEGFDAQTAGQALDYRFSDHDIF